MPLALLWRYRAALGWTLAVGFALTLWHANNLSHERIGAMREQAKQDSAEIARLTKAADTSALRLRVDTVTLRKAVTHYDTVLAERTVTDTIWVDRYIAAADTAIRACRRALNDCTVLAAQRDSLAQKLLVRLSAQTILSKPSKFGLAVKLVGAAGVGYLIGRHR